MEIISPLNLNQMFSTNGSIRLVSTLYNYLMLIQQANNAREVQRSKLALYDNPSTDIYSPIRLMYRRENIVAEMIRYESLSAWLVRRYLKVKSDYDKETFKRTSDPLTHNKIKIAEL